MIGIQSLTLHAWIPTLPPRMLISSRRGVVLGLAMLLIGLGGAVSLILFYMQSSKVANPEQPERIPRVVWGFNEGSYNIGLSDDLGPPPKPPVRDLAATIRQGQSQAEADAERDEKENAEFAKAQQAWEAKKAALAAQKVAQDAELEAQRQAVAAQLKSAPVVYKTPDTVNYGELAQVGLVISLGDQAEASGVLSSINGTETRAQASVSRIVRAKLTGPSDLVDIKLRGGDAAERQVVNAYSPVEWIWDIRGLKAGEAKLSMQIFSEVKLDGTKEPILVRSFDRTITINISLLGKIKALMSDYGPLLGGIATALTTFLGLCTTLGWTPWKKKPTEAAT